MRARALLHVEMDALSWPSSIRSYLLLHSTQVSALNGFSLEKLRLTDLSEKLSGEI